MSDRKDPLTLRSDDLASTSSKNQHWKSIVATLEEEKRRLQEENRLLKECLLHTQKNASLKTANILYSILAWSDENLSTTLIRKLLSDFKSDERANQSFQIVTPEKQQVPFISVQGPTPVATNSSIRYNSSVSTKQKNTQKNVETDASQNDNRSSRIIMNQVLPNKRDSSMVEGDNISRSHISKGNNPVKDPYIQSNTCFEDAVQDQSDQILFKSKHKNLEPQEEEETWASMLDLDQEKTPVPGSLKRLQPERKQPESNIGSDKTTSEGYGSQIQGQQEQSSVGNNTGRDMIGDPIAASTPLRDNSSKDAKTELPLLNRPIDKIIGLQPTLSDLQLNQLAKLKLNKRLIGEIAFQLDRRILDFVFAWQKSGDPRRKIPEDQPKKRRYYGFSLSNIGQMIRKEAIDSVTGKFDPRKELEMRYRFDYVMRTLKKFGYNLEIHGNLSQDMVNNYGLLTEPPDRKTVQNFGLEDPVILRILMRQLISDDTELSHELVLLDCLCLLAYDDRRPLFMW